MNNIVENIWNDFNKELKGFIIKKVKDDDLADDLLQDVFIKIIKNIAKVSKSKNIRQYIFGITRNVVYDHFRNTAVDEDFSEFQEPFTKEETQSLNYTIADCCIRPFIAQLPHKYQEVLTKTEFDNISQKNLALQLNLSYSGTKSRVQRGKEKLKELILACCNFPSDKYGNLLPSETKNCNC